MKHIHQSLFGYTDEIYFDFIAEKRLLIIRYKFATRWNSPLDECVIVSQITCRYNAKVKISDDNAKNSLMMEATLIISTLCVGTHTKI